MAGRCLGLRMLKLPPRAGAAEELHQHGQELAALGLPSHGVRGGHDGCAPHQPRAASWGCLGKLQLELCMLCSLPLP